MVSASPSTHRVASGPDPSQVAPLVEQASALSRELREEHRRLNGTGVGAPVELLSRLQNVRERADEIVAELGTADASPADSARTLAAMRAEARELFGECFDVAVRPLVRGPDLGRGACEVADVLLCAVAQRCGIAWPHFTSIGAADFFTSVSHIVRLAYPPSPIWNLAIAVHELGHYCGPNWPGPTDKNPYERFAVRSQLAPEQREELFADMFAVFTVGPAFVLACLARFNPIHRPASDVLTKAAHPPDAQRAAWILFGLDALAASAVGASAVVLRKLTDGARSRWNALCQACGEPIPDNLPVLEDEADRLIRGLRTSRPDAQYLDLADALALRAFYGNPTASLPANPHPVDVLNAAWFLRRDAGTDDLEAMRGIERWGSDLIRGFTCR